MAREPLDYYPALPRDASVEAEFTGSLTLTEDGSIRPTQNGLGGVVDRFGVTRPEDDDYYERYER